GCTSPTYDGPDDNLASVTGTCSDRAGNSSASLAFDLKYDATDPEVTGAQPDRAPGDGGWFLDPVRFDFTGTDATAGIDACPPVVYSGPDGPSSEVVGECRDRAGNVAARSFDLKFDGNPPGISGLSAQPGDRRLDLRWQATADVTAVRAMRSPGVGTDASTLVFDGDGGTGFSDQRVDNGVRYTYEVTVWDAAGNRASATVSGTPVAPAPTGGTTPPPAARRTASKLLAPLPGAVVKAGHPPELRWMRVKRAAYYNV